MTPLPGDSFAIELNVAGLGDGAAPSLGAFDVRISFDLIFGLGVAILARASQRRRAVS